MKRRLIIAIEIVVLLLSMALMNRALGLLNARSDASVSAGVVILLAIGIVVPSLILFLRDRLHHPKPKVVTSIESKEETTK